MGDKPTQQRVGMLGVTKVAGAVERMKTGSDQARGVADIVKPRGRLDQVGVAAEDGREATGPGGDAVRVSPATRQGNLKKPASGLFGPCSQCHDPTLCAWP